MFPEPRKVILTILTFKQLPAIPSSSETATDTDMCENGFTEAQMLVLGPLLLQRGN